MHARVLVIDDDPSIRKLLHKLLSLRDFAVEEAVDGVDALEKIGQERYDAIILDLMMPRLDGFAVVRELRQSQPEVLPRVIVATAYPNIGNDQLRGVCRILSKPFEIQELLDSVRACLEIPEQPS